MGSVREYKFPARLTILLALMHAILVIGLSHAVAAKKIEACWPGDAGQTWRAVDSPVRCYRRRRHLLYPVIRSSRYHQWMDKSPKEILEKSAANVALFERIGWQIVLLIGLAIWVACEPPPERWLPIGVFMLTVLATVAREIGVTKQRKRDRFP